MPSFRDVLTAATREAFRERYGRGPAMASYAPGRVNLIGDHTDYNDGFALPMTIDRGLCTVLRPRTDEVVRATSQQASEARRYVLGDDVPARGSLWARYVFGVVRELHEAGLLDRGADLVVAGDLPSGAGLSSSAALTMSVGMAFQAAAGFELAPAAMARLGQRVEHRYVDVQCGIMDQLAIRTGRAGHALRLDCRSLAYVPIPLPLDRAAVVVVNSRVARSLAGSAYNERRATCEAVVASLAAAGVRTEAGTPPRALRDVTEADLDTYREHLGERAYRRAQHVVRENARVQHAAEALRDGDVEAVGRLMTASHTSLRDDYEVSGPELDLLVDLAHEHGALGARMTGAGFGGCTVQLVPPAATTTFAERVQEGYRAETGREAEVFVIHANEAVGVVEAA